MMFAFLNGGWIAVSENPRSDEEETRIMSVKTNCFRIVTIKTDREVLIGSARIPTCGYPLSGATTGPIFRVKEEQEMINGRSWLWRKGVVTALLMVAVLVISSCDTGVSNGGGDSSGTTTDDENAPTTADSSVSADGTTVTIVWGAATDDVSAAAELVYLVYVSTDSNEPFQNGDPIGGWTVASELNQSGDDYTITYEGQTDQSYFFQVAVEDPAGNRALYDPVTISLQPELTINLDPTFGDGGVVFSTDASGGGRDRGYDFVLTAGDDIVATGRSEDVAGYGDLAVWKVTSNGIFDSSFSGDGVFTHDNAGGIESYVQQGNTDPSSDNPDQGRSVSIDDQGRIVVGGSSFGSTESGTTFWRLSASGALDTSFDGDGFKHFNSVQGFLDFHFDDSGAVYSTGTIQGAGSVIHEDMALRKYTSDFSIDTGFGNSGTVRYRFDSEQARDDIGYAVTTDDTGRIYVAGKIEKELDEFDLAVWRFSADGTLDNTFGLGGVATYVTSGRFSSLYDIAIHNNGTDDGLIAVGTYDGNSSTMVAWRLNADGSTDSTFGDSGIVRADRSSRGNAVTVDGSDNIYIAGRYLAEGGSIDMAVWKLEPDGSYDNTFNGDGLGLHDDPAGLGGSISASDEGHDIEIDSQGRIVVVGSSSHVEDEYFVAWRLD